MEYGLTEYSNNIVSVSKAGYNLLLNTLSMKEDFVGRVC
jgi:hypothetical protein